MDIRHLRWLYSGLSGIRARRLMHHGSLEVERPKGRRLRLGHLQVGELQHWNDFPPCIALDLAIQFKLLAGIRARTQIWVQDKLSSSGPHCTKWADDQHRPAGFERQLVLDLLLPYTPSIIDLRVIDLVSNPVWWETETNIGYPVLQNKNLTVLSMGDWNMLNVSPIKG